VSLFGLIGKKNRGLNLPKNTSITSSRNYGNSINDPEGWSNTTSVNVTYVNLIATTPSTGSEKSFTLSANHNYAIYTVNLNVRSITVTVEIVDSVSNLIIASTVVSGGINIAINVTGTVSFRIPTHKGIKVRLRPTTSLGTGWGLSLDNDSFSFSVHPFEGLPVAPSLQLGFDGVDDYVSIEGSNVPGNPYDFEYTDSFIVALKIKTPKRFISGKNLFLYSKMASSLVTANVKGYTSYIDGSTLGINMGMFSNGSTSRVQVVSVGSISPDAEYIFIFEHNPTPQFSYYAGATGTLIFTNTSIGNGSYDSLSGGTIKNTGKLTFGVRDIVNNIGFYDGLLSHISIFSGTMNATVRNDLALKIAQNKVKEHSLYNSNCLGYWRQIMGKKLWINEKNPLYHGTLNNF
jgi:hypothetical protein